jgi:sugar diacid utilization regulator
LLEGKIGDKADANVRARYLGYSLPRHLRVALINVAGLGEEATHTTVDADAVDQRRSALLGRLERLAAASGASKVLSARRASALALVVPWQEDLQEVRKFASMVVRGLVEREPDLKFTMGVSACHEMCGDLSQAFSEAQTALASASESASPVSVFEDLGILRFLLAPGNRADLAEFVNQVLGSVITYDKAHSTHLTRTLAAYLAEDRNLRRTAERLYIHPKTVRYRLDRVNDLISRDLKNQRDCFDIQLALQIMSSLASAAGANVRALAPECWPADPRPGASAVALSGKPTNAASTLHMSSLEPAGGSACPGRSRRLAAARRNRRS